MGAREFSLVDTEDGAKNMDQLEYKIGASFLRKKNKEVDQILSDYESNDHYVDTSVAPEQQYLSQWKRSTRSKLKTRCPLQTYPYDRLVNFIGTGKKPYPHTLPQDTTECLGEWESFLNELHGAGELSLEASNREAVFCFMEDTIAPIYLLRYAPCSNAVI